MRRIVVFDTTLRDGEQSPGATMTPAEKLRVARQLDALGVDVIEAGFPVSSPDDFAAVQRIAREVRRPAIAALARAALPDIDSAARALQGAERPRLHVFLATSDIHLDRKLGISRAECVDRVARAVAHARRQADDVEFSAEDATRTDPAFLAAVVRTAIAAGARTINIPDTVGYAYPEEIRRLMTTLRESVPETAGVILSVHCHNDLGLAVANSLAAIEAGAGQVECTVNGIGERAGNAALEEIVMALVVRRDVSGCETGIRTEEIFPTSRLLSSVIGIHPQPNKAIVGRNAFAHEAGIHQDGMIKDPSTYEIMRPELVGVPGSRLVLGKHSGRRALAKRYEELGYRLTPEEVGRLTKEFKRLADRKKAILDEDLIALLQDESMNGAEDVYELARLDIVCGTEPPRATVRLREPGGVERQATAQANGPLTAAFAAVDRIVGLDATLEDLTIRSATAGSDAPAEVALVVRAAGRTFAGRGLSSDVVHAAMRAYLHAVNKAARALPVTVADHAPAAEDYLWGV